MTKTGLWSSLDALFTGEAVIADWKREMGSEFRVGREYLFSTGRVSERHPCTSSTPCGCLHRVSRTPDGGFAAACSCETADCPTFRLKLEDVVLHGVNADMVGDAVRRGFGLEQTDVKPRELLFAGWRHAVGMFGPKQHLAVLICALDEDELVGQMDVLLDCGWDHWLVLTPTERLHSDVALGKARRNGCAIAALSQFLLPEEGWRMHPLRSIEPILEEVGKLPREGRKMERVVEEIHREIATVRTDFHDMRRVKERLAKMQSEKLFAFVSGIDFDSFRVFCSILAHGDVAKACRAMNVSDSTLRSRIAEWENRGEAYKVLLELVRWRKQIGRKGVVPLNEAITKGTAANADFEGLLADVLDELLEMTEDTWEEKCEALTTLLRRYVPR